MPVINYKEVLDKLAQCDFVEFHGDAHIRTKIPVELRIYKGTPNWEYYVARILISHGSEDYGRNKCTYGFWNAKNFPEISDTYESDGLSMKECFFSLDGELIRHIPQERMKSGTQEILDSIQRKLSSIQNTKV